MAFDKLDVALRHNTRLSLPMVYYKTDSCKQTKKLAADLAKKIYTQMTQPSPAARGAQKNPHKYRNALALALQGDLGSGKTTFVQGFLRSLGVRKKIASPTFVIFKNYPITRPFSYRNAYHVDCYRIKQPEELLDLGFKEILNNPHNIVLIEWPERIKKILPKNTIRLNFKHGQKENQRSIRLKL